jgi:DNA-binding LacI/PurR family transcriptional regulator
MDVGRIAVQNLHRMIEANRQSKMPNEPTATLLKPELIVRASSLAS